MAVHFDPTCGAAVQLVFEDVERKFFCKRIRADAEKVHCLLGSDSRIRVTFANLRIS